MINDDATNGNFLFSEKLALLKKRLEEVAELETSVFSVTAGQQSLWLLNCKDPTSAAYNVAFAACICDSLPVVAMKRAWQLIVNRHAALRTSFAFENGQLVQKVHGYQPVNFEIIEATQLQNEEFDELVKHYYEQPFELEKGPVYRVQLFQKNLQESVLMFTAHHIAVDGASLWIILKELKAFYIAELTSQKIQLTPLATRYSDFVRYQELLLAGRQGEILQQYWLKQLEGSLPSLEIVTDKPRPLVRTFRGASFDFTLDSGDIKALKELAGKEQTTLFTVIMATLQTLLYRYTHQDDILVGSPMLGRIKEEYQGLVGYFSNPVVIRGRPCSHLPFREFLAQIRQTVIAAIVHQEYPFSVLENQLEFVRQPNRSPLFQCWFSYLKSASDPEIQALFFPAAASNRVYWNNLPLEPYHLPQQEGQFELSLFVMESSEHISFTFKYNTDLFVPETIRRMSRHFTNVLKGIIADPGMCLMDLPLMDQQANDQILIHWNNTATLLPAETCIQHLFEAQVERSLDRPAVMAGQQLLSYRQLNNCANQLTAYLKHRGVKDGDCIGLYIGRSTDMVVALLAILKSGGVYVPLDIQNPPERIKGMVESVSLSLILSTEAYRENLCGCPAEVIFLDACASEIGKESTQNPDAMVQQNQSSHIIFTSGSTGQPKAVRGHHKGLINFFHYLTSTYDVGADDIVLQLAPYSFDACFRDMIFPLTVGAKVVMVSDWEYKDPRALIQKITQHQVTCLLSIVPSLLSAMVNEGIAAIQGATSVRLILTSGEALLNTLCQKVKTVFGNHVCIVNQYGPTECTMISTYYRVSAEENETIPIGRPINNVKVYILNELKPVPVGVMGEIFIGGAGLCYGYLNQPKLTREKFIPDHFSKIPGEQLYRTGDLGYYLPDGTMVFSGRKDHQVKIRGTRVELKEIENMLLVHPQVNEAVVVYKNKSEAIRYLAAYYVPVKDKAIQAADLREYMQRWLPPYMVPSVFIPLSALPRNKNGKLDREHLSIQIDSVRELDQPIQGPRNPAEALVAEIFSSCTTGNPVGIFDNFFYIGGNSLNAVQVLSRIRELFHVNLPVKSIFENPTVAGITDALIQNEPFDGAIHTIADYYHRINQMSQEEIEQTLTSKRSKKSFE